MTLLSFFWAAGAPFFVSSMIFLRMSSAPVPFRHCVAKFHSHENQLCRQDEVMGLDGNLVDS